MPIQSSLRIITRIRGVNCLEGQAKILDRLIRQTITRGETMWKTKNYVVKRDAKRPETTSKYRRLAVTLGGSVFALGSLAAPALAQTPINVEGIDGRIPQEYRPEPIRINAFELLPYIELETELVDNVFATETGALDDTLVTALVGLTLRDRRSDRQIALTAKGGYEDYLDNTFDDRLRLDVNGNARFGLGTLTETYFGAGVRVNGLQTSGFMGTGTVGQPINLTTYQANAGVQREIGELTASVEGRYRTTEYSGDFFVREQQFLANIRDLDVLQMQGRLAYSLSPRDRIYVQGIYADRQFPDLTGREDLIPELREDRSSNDSTLRLGYARTISEVLRLDANIGYINRSYEDPSRADGGSLSFDARLAWQPSRLTDLDIRASRSVYTDDDPLSTGSLRTDVSFGLQHELLRNVILAADAKYSWLELDNSGQDVNLFFDDGKEIVLGLSGRYLFTKKWSARLRAEHLNRDGFSSGSQSRVSLGLRYNF